MKKSIILVFVLSFSNFLLSQDEVKESFNPTSIKPIDQDDIWSVDVAVNTWSKEQQSPVARKLSYTLGLTYHYEFNFSQDKRFAIALGVGYKYTQLNHNGRFSNDSTNSTQWNPVTHAENIDYSRLNLHSIVVPLEFRIKTKKEFKLYIGYQMSAYLGIKNKSRIDGNKRSFSTFNTFNTFQHGPRIRIGFKDYFIYGNMFLSNLFSNTKNTSIQLFEIGISLGG